MATTADFRTGMCIVHNGQLHLILAFQHVKPGKGGAYFRTKLKNIEKGKIFDYTFAAGTKVETARIEQRASQFLYRDEINYHFMDLKNFANYTLSKDQIDSTELLKEGQEMNVTLHQETEQALHGELPPFVYLKVAYTEPAIKGDTATRALKYAVLETQAKLKVPLFIQVGDLLKIDTRTGDYLERAKKA